MQSALHIHRFEVNPFQENTYLVAHTNGSAFLVDPGFSDGREEQDFEDALRRQKLSLKEVVLTHAHIDHVLGLAYIHRCFGHAPVMHASDLPLLERAPAIGQAYGVPCPQPPDPKGFLEHGHPFVFEGEELEVRHAPGHSPGSLVFIYHPGKWVLVGDVLFAGSIGRTDLPGGNHQELLQSIAQQLLTLPDDYAVYPGHGPQTTIGAERRSNPFLQP